MLEQGCIVLVHCQQGVDRSATVVAAFCMAYFDPSTTQGREGLKRLRPACTEQVPAYEELLRANESKILRFFDSLNHVQNERPDYDVKALLESKAEPNDPGLIDDSTSFNGDE